MSSKDAQSGPMTVSACAQCSIVMWPPRDICSRCLGATSLQSGPTTGVIAEFSQKNGRYFCLVDLGCDIRIIGSLPAGQTPEIGKKVGLTCTKTTDGYAFEINLL